jgi:hypothetical protein
VLRNPSFNGSDIVFDTGRECYGRALINYKTILDVVKPDHFSCGKCHRFKVRCHNCLDKLYKHRIETMKLSILTATAEIAECESALMELFLSSRRDMEVRDNQMLLLCGYRYTHLTADICHN